MGNYSDEPRDRRGFSDEEHHRIREHLIETARELLLTYRPEKITITDITEPVGIGKGSFYRFFDSKADLYLVILQREIEEFVEQVRSELSDVDEPHEGLERLFWCYAEFAEENPLVRQMVIQNDYQKLVRNVSPDRIEQMQSEEMAELLPIIEPLRTEGSGMLENTETATLLGLMGGSIGLLALHKDEFDEFDAPEIYEEGYYRRVQNVLISSLARGLTADDR